MQRPLLSLIELTTKHLFALTVSDSDIFDACQRCVKHFTKGSDTYAVWEWKMQSDMMLIVFIHKTPCMPTSLPLSSKTGTT